MENTNTGRPNRFVGAPTIFGSERRQFSSNKGTSVPQDTGDVPMPWNLLNFYSQDQDPWHPPNIIPVLATDCQIRKLPGSVGFQADAPSFQGFRSSHLPSECDTLPEDSGYGGSRPPYSIENTSVYEEDRNPEAQIATHRIETLHLQPDASHEAQLQNWSQPRRPTSMAVAPASGDNRYHCQECNSWHRTRSEHK